VATRVPILLLAAVLGASLLASACRRECGGRAEEADGGLPPWVSADELLPRIAGGRAVVFDTRARDAYRRGHIAGAWALPLDEVAPSGGELDRATRERLAAVLASTGFDPGAELVVTDGDGWEGLHRAAAGCWLLALAGAQRCSLLTGGAEAWRAAGGAVVLDQPVPPTDPRPVRIPARPPALASLEFVRGATARPEGAIVDVRDGAEDPARGGEEGGSIPGALIWPLPPPLPSGTTRAAGAPFDVAAIEQSAAAAGLFAEREIVVVGHGFEDGALGWFLLRHALGVRDAKLFPGGVAAWREHPTLPFAAARPGPAAAL
jgi:thiosulfate/3-mercaptopyruvate sulfurtransferase